MFLIAAENLSVVRGRRVLGRGLNFALAAGEVLHLRGSNGAGKTSLLEVLSGLREPAAGRIAPRPEAEFLHWLGHKNALSPSLTPTENLEFWCGLNETSSSGIQDVLKQMGVSIVRHKPCRALSAGQKRRTALARLLLAHRPLWLLDEPLDGLDAQGLACFAELLNQHLRKGGAAVITSHQPLPAGVACVRELQLS